MKHTPDQLNTIFDAWETLRRHRWRFIFPAFLVTAVVLAMGMILPRKYRAEATFERRTDMVLAEIINRGAPETYQDPRATLYEELAGQPAVDQLVKDLKPLFTQRYGYYDPQMLAAELGKRILIKSDIASHSVDRVRVGFTTDDALLAQEVVNRLVSNYITRTRAALDDRLQQTQAFFQAEVQRARQTIEEMENRKVAFEIDHAALLPDSTDGVPSAIQQSRSMLQTAQQNLDAATLRVAALQRALSATPAQIPSVVKARNPELDRLESKLREAQTQLASMTGPLKMTERHPDVLTTQQVVADLQKRVAGTEREVVVQTNMAANPKHNELDLQLTDARAQLQAYEAQVAAIQKELDARNEESADLFPVRADYRKLSREVEQVQRQLAFWEDNLRRVSMAQTAETGNRGVQLQFIKPCGPLTLPVSPNLVQLLLAAIATGAVAGALGVFFAARADESFTDGESLANAFNLPLMGSVSEIISRQQRTMRRLRNLVIFPTSAAAMAGVLLFMISVLYANLEQPAAAAAASDPAPVPAEPAPASTESALPMTPSKD